MPALALEVVGRAELHGDEAAGGGLATTRPGIAAGA